MEDEDLIQSLLEDSDPSLFPDPSEIDQLEETESRATQRDLPSPVPDGTGDLAIREPEGYQVPPMNVRQQAAVQNPDAVRNPVVPLSAVFPHVQQPVMLDVHPVSVREPRGATEAQILEPARVAAAAATAELRTRVNPQQAEVNPGVRVEHVAVSPNHRVTHMFPRDLQDVVLEGLSLVDRDIDLPPMQEDLDPPTLPEYPPVEPLQNSEQLVVDMAYQDDQSERSLL